MALEAAAPHFEPAAPPRAMVSEHHHQHQYYNPQRRNGGRASSASESPWRSPASSASSLRSFLSVLWVLQERLSALSWPSRPAPFYVILYLWMDRYDPEPAWALASRSAGGALVSPLSLSVVNTLFGGSGRRADRPGDR